MMRFVLPLAFGLAGAVGGIAAGLHLRPQTEAAVGEAEEAAGAAEAGEPDAATAPMHDRARPPLDETDFVRLANQFIVPVLDDGEVTALVVLSLGVEVRTGMRPVVFAREPKLRDAFLRVMFDHANAGGFDRDFTAGPQIEALRRSLWEVARPILGPEIYDVLITDIARQEA